VSAWVNKDALEESRSERYDKQNKAGAVVGWMWAINNTGERPLQLTTVA
jgi:hypothetical protein